MTRHERERARRILDARDRADAWCREIGMRILPGTHRDFEDLARTPDSEKTTE